MSRHSKYPAQSSFSIETKVGEVSLIVRMPDEGVFQAFFRSPEQILELSYRLIEAAGVVWPNNPWMKEYKTTDS